MHHISPTKIFCILLALFTGGCASVGQKFDSTKVQTLDLGSMHDTDFHAAFGDPHSDIRNSDSDGSYEEVTYLYAHADLSNAQARQLTLEFKDGSLNGYNYFSSFDEDKTSADPSKTSAIKRGVSTKSDVVSLLGKPHGKIKTPTKMPDFTKFNKPGVAEIWCWVAIGSVSTFGDHSTTSNVIVISFDPSGVVTDVSSQQQNTAGQ